MAYVSYYFYLRKEDLFIKSFHQAVKIFSKENNYNTIIATITYNYATLINETNPDPVNNPFYQKYVDYAVKGNNPLITGNAYNNLALYIIRSLPLGSEIAAYEPAFINIKKAFIAYSKFDIGNKMFEIDYNIDMATAYILMHPQRIKEATPYFERAEELMKTNPVNDLRKTLIYNNFGVFYENKNNLKKALEFYFKSIDHQKKTNGGYKDLYNTYQNISNIYALQNDYANALKYEIAARDYRSKFYEGAIVSKVKSLELFYETKSKNELIQKLEQKNNSDFKIRLLLIAITIMSIVAVVFIYFWFRHKSTIQDQNAKLLASQSKLLEIQKEQLEKQALAASLQIKSKNDFLNDLKNKIKNNKDLDYGKLIKEEASSDKEFNSVLDMVQSIHPNFYKKLNEISNSKLTNLDFKYSAYIYLNMDNQQISKILKADPNTVRTNKYRLKQKFGLSKDQDLRDFFHSLDFSMA